MKLKTIILLLLLSMSVVKAEIELHLLWQVPENVTDLHVSDLDGDGYREILLGTGYSYEKTLSTSAGSVTATICEGTVSQFEPDGGLVWEKKLCKSGTALDPCYSNGCISAIYADSICTTTRELIFVGCCYCGKSSVVKVYDSDGTLIQELYDDDGLGAPVPFQGCIRRILVEDINADNCKDIIVATDLELFCYITTCSTCTIPTIPTFKTVPGGLIYDVIVVNFDDSSFPTKEIVVAADSLTVFTDTLTVKWVYSLVPGEPVKTVYAYDLDSDTPAHEIDQDPDLEPELIVGQSWYIYVLDNMDQGDSDPLNDQPDLKWEYSTSPYNVATVHAGRFVGPRNVMGGSASLVHILDYNGTALQIFNAPNEVRKLAIADFDRDAQNDLVVFSNNYVSIFSTLGMLWSSEDLQGNFIDGIVSDLNIDGHLEIVAGYTLGLYVIGIEELKSVTGSEADRLYNLGEDLMEKGDLMKALIYFEQARIKYEEVGNTFMAIQCQKNISECEKFLDTDRIVATALEELRNYEYEQASYLFGEAADLYARVGEKSKMSQMRVLKEASEKLWQAHTTLWQAHQLLFDESWTEARVESTWARHSFEDVSSLFLTMSLDSLYETLKLEISSRIRECDEVVQLCDQLIEAESCKEEADTAAKDADRFFRNQQYSEARTAYEQAEDSYTETAQLLDEIQITLGKRADSFRRDILEIERKIKTLNDSELYKTYEDVQTTQTIAGLEGKKLTYKDLIDEYGDYAESIGRKARDCRTQATNASNQASQCYSLEDKFLEYGREVLKPPTSLAVGLACLIVALVGLAAGKGRYVALGFLVLVLIFLGVSILRFSVLKVP
jgi:hypothetical protein